MPKKAYIKTFGCQMNEHDSQRMLRHLAQDGYMATNSPQEADVVIVNTCSVRDGAYHKAMSEIGRYRNWGKEIRVGVTGCVASQLGEAIASRFDFVDFVLGTDHVDKIREAVKYHRVHGNAFVRADFQEIEDYTFPDMDVAADERMVSAYVTIMKGCDNTCAFCIVPMTRGAEVSRPPASIVDEIKHLEGQGVREITLLGQNVNSYGKRLSEPVDFATLLRIIEQRTQISRLRFTSPHPKDLSDRLIDEYCHNRVLCRHFHLPAQSGSSRVLKRMRRAHTRETYMRRVERLRRTAPDVAITTDLIVGFPGETEADFQETLRLVNEVEYDAAYVFAYSPRPGTEAADFVDDVPPETKQRRLQELLNLQESISLRKNQPFVGRDIDILVEGSSRRGGDQLSGRSSCHRVVNFHGCPQDIGAIVPVRIERASAYALFGEKPHVS